MPDIRNISRALSGSTDVLTSINYVLLAELSWACLALPRRILLKQSIFPLGMMGEQRTHDQRWYEIDF